MLLDLRFQAQRVAQFRGLPKTGVP